MANDLNFKILRAEKLALEIIEKYGINSPEHLRVRDIAFEEKATVVEEKIGRAAASIVRTGEYATIRVPPTDTPERKRFSIAHEVGHLKMGHIQTVQRVCTQEDMRIWHKSSQETEANFFASEMILPTKLVHKRCNVPSVNFEPIKDIAKDFRSSLTATAIKFVRLCPEKCAVVYSVNGNILWFYKSDDWWHNIPKGLPLDKRTIAYDFFKGESIPDMPEEVDADAWISSRSVDEIVEHSIGSRNYNFVLSILWIKP